MLKPSANSEKETETVVSLETPVLYEADLPDLNPGDKVIREDGITYTIAGDYDSLISPDGIYYDPMTLKPYSDQQKAAVMCEEYDIYASMGLAMRSSRHRAKLDEYYGELALNGEIDGENGLTAEQARRIQIKIRKFDKEDEEAMLAAYD